MTQTFLQSCLLLNRLKKKISIHPGCVVSLLTYHPLSNLIIRYLISAWHGNGVQRPQVYLVAGCGWGVCYSLCVAVCARSVPLRHLKLSQLCTNSPPGSSGLSHLLSACWASSNLAASDGETGALGVSSPQDCQKSSVKSPYRLAPQAPRKLTGRRECGGADTGRNFFFLFFFFSVYAATLLLFHKRHPPWSLPVVISCGGVWGAAEERKKIK